MRLALSKLGRRYGALKQKPDHRDLGFASFLLSAKAHPAILLDEPKIDLSENLGTVRDQGDEGSCTGQASAGFRDWLFRSQNQYEIAKANIQNPLFSAAMLYALARTIDGTPLTDDSGSTTRSVLKALNQTGVCLDSDWPYKAGRFSDAPNAAEITAASTFKSGAYHFLGGVSDMKACLASGYCFIFGMAVYESFEDTGADGLVKVPDISKEQPLGGHEQLVYGYDDTVQCPNSSSKGAFAVRNSWGSGWGAGGNEMVAYEQMERDFMDAGVTHLGGPWGGQQQPAA